MVKLDEDALICDFAEVYHIHKYRELPLKYAAVLAYGLPDDSRIKRRMSGAKTTTPVLLQAAAADALNMLVWMQTKDAQRGVNRPARILDAIIGEPAEKPDGFATGEDFARRWQELIGE